MPANDIQIGGTHYKGTAYQHWDFITDVNMPYLPATATKYIARWRRSNKPLGQDLAKAIHYIDKCAEKAPEWTGPSNYTQLFWAFATANKLELADVMIIDLISCGLWQQARDAVQDLLDYQSSRN